MNLPKRPGPYVLALLLILLAVLTAWMFYLLTSPSVQKAIVSRTQGAPPARTEPAQPVQSLPSPSGARMSSGGVDPHLQGLADSLHAEDQPALRDLEIVASFLDTYARGMGGVPAGDNADITAAITGTQYPGQKGRVFPQNHRSIRNGQIVDRWGQPLWFHSNSANSTEIRSAGPDKQLFTSDDVVLNPSPEGLGVTPPPDSGKAQ